MSAAARLSRFPARGAIAQLGERYNGIVEVAGSIPAGSTNRLPSNAACNTSPSSRGPGHYPFTVATGVRIPLGTPRQWMKKPAPAGFFVSFVLLPHDQAGRGFTRGLQRRDPMPTLGK